MELALMIASVLISVVGGGCGGIAAIFRISRQLDRRFDATDKELQSLAHRYDVQAAKEQARIELIEYRLSNSEQMISHKFKRCENAISQLSRFLEKGHGYHPRSMFPLNSGEEDE